MMAKRKARLKQGTRDFAKPRGEVTLPRWDRGASGPANRIGLVEEPVTWTNDEGEVVNPNGVKRMRRVDMLEVYHSRGWISDRGYTAGEALRDAWCNTQRGKGVDWSAERVDSSPKPDAAIDIQIDRFSRLVSVSNCIAAEDHAILWVVVGKGRSFAHLREYRALRHDRGREHLRAALDRLADRLGM